MNEQWGKFPQIAIKNINSIKTKSTHPTFFFKGSVLFVHASVFYTW